MKKNHFGGRLGFSLIELAIVMSISGLLLAAGFHFYRLYYKDQEAHLSYDNERNLASAISNFASSSSRLPCPADPTLPLTDPNAGLELPPAFCTTLKLSPFGTCMKYSGVTAAAGVCVTAGRDTAFDTDSTGDPVLIGAVPFASVKLGSGLSKGWTFTSGTSVQDCESIATGSPAFCDADSNGALDAGVRVKATTANFDAATLAGVLDPWGYQMTYAVTGTMTDAVTSNSSYGAIYVQTEDGVPLVKPIGSAHYVLVSHGDNHMGAYNATGKIAIPCTTGGQSIDEENCNGDATFVEGLRSVNTSNAAGKLKYFDDVTVHQVVNISKLWDFANSADIYNLNVGNVGIGTASPSQKLEVAGNLRAGKGSQTALCDTGGVSCWDPNDLGGAGSQCAGGAFPPGAGKARVAIGIRAGKVYCTKDPTDPTFNAASGDVADPTSPTPLTNQTCAAGTFMVGFTGAGNPYCYNPATGVTIP